jgi:hypothetical protein
VTHLVWHGLVGWEEAGVAGAGKGLLIQQVVQPIRYHLDTSIYTFFIFRYQCIVQRKDIFNMFFKPLKSTQTYSTLDFKTYIFIIIL